MRQGEPLGGPWLVIARRVRMGHVTYSQLRAAAQNAKERSKLGGNLRCMVRTGLLNETRSGGVFSLTTKCEELM